jgi:hypothetical protein
VVESARAASKNSGGALKQGRGVLQQGVWVEARQNGGGLGGVDLAMLLQFAPPPSFVLFVVCGRHADCLNRRRPFDGHGSCLGGVVHTDSLSCRGPGSVWVLGKFYAQGIGATRDNLGQCLLSKCLSLFCACTVAICCIDSMVGWVGDRIVLIPLVEKLGSGNSAFLHLLNAYLPFER